MKIEIAERLKPFSHTPGAACLIPGTWVVVQAFPTKIQIGEAISLQWRLTGPVEEFTLQQDLEKNCVWIFGKAREGYYRLRLSANDAGFHLQADRAPASGIAFSGSLTGVLKKKETLELSAETEFFLPERPERLSLGSHKNQDWDEVQKRCDLKEMLPVLFFLGQKIPRVLPQPLKGTARLLALPDEKSLAAPALQALLKAAFSKVLVPRLNDDRHQGFVPEEPAQGNPCFLVQEGAKLVRSLFFRQNERRLQFLPFLPIPLDCGRMTGVQAPGIGEIDFEWSKKSLRRAVLRASTSGEVLLDLQTALKTFRVRASLKEKGKRHAKAEPLLVEKGKTYFLDLFQS